MTEKRRWRGIAIFMIVFGSWLHGVHAAADVIIETPLQEAVGSIEETMGNPLFILVLVLVVAAIAFACIWYMRKKK